MLASIASLVESGGSNADALLNGSCCGTYGCCGGLAVKNCTGGGVTTGCWTEQDVLICRDAVYKSAGECLVDGGRCRRVVVECMVINGSDEVLFSGFLPTINVELSMLVVVLLKSNQGHSNGDRSCA